MKLLWQATATREFCDQQEVNNKNNDKIFKNDKVKVNCSVSWTDFEWLGTEKIYFLYQVKFWGVLNDFWIWIHNIIYVFCCSKILISHLNYAFAIESIKLLRNNNNNGYT